MAYTIDEYNALKSAYALGATSVKYADKQVDYRSRGDMLAILGEMESELNIGSKVVRRKLAVADKGIYSQYE